MARYFWNILIWIDQGLNVIFAPLLNIFSAGGFGDPDETLSSVFAKGESECKLCKFMCRILNFIDPGHCEKSREDDEGDRAL